MESDHILRAGGRDEFDHFVVDFVRLHGLTPSRSLAPVRPSVHQFRHIHGLPGFGIKGVQSRRRAFSRFDVRVDVAMCCIRLSVAQYTANFR